MPPRGYESITVPKALAARLRRMKKGLKKDSIVECLEYVLRLMGY